jgi:hypothetical protein
VVHQPGQDENEGERDAHRDVQSGEPDDQAGQEPSLAARVAIMRPQLKRIAADVLCLQEVHSQDGAQGRTLAALDTLLADTGYEAYARLTTETTSGQVYQERNLVILRRFPLVDHPRQIIRDSSGPARPTRSPPPIHPTRPPTPWSGNGRSCTPKSTLMRGGCCM